MCEVVEQTFLLAEFDIRVNDLIGRLLFTPLKVFFIEMDSKCVFLSI
jgi:hypothetical protein